MAGIVGVVDLSGRTAIEPLIGRMLNSLRYDPKFPVASLAGPQWGMGQAWLGCFPGTCSPVRSDSGRWFLALDGEVDNLDELTPETASWSGEDSQARRLVQLLERDGIEALTQAQGSFAIAAWDDRAQRAVLLNDRLGLRPLYYAHRGRKLLWASKVQSLLEDHDVPRQLDVRAVTELLTYEYVLGHRTLVEGVALLPPATLLTFQDGAITLWRYWRLRFEPRPMTMDEALEAFRATLTHALERQTARLERVGVPLSGGKDSRTIIGLLSQSQFRGSIESFTFGFPESQDVRSAGQVARRVGASHAITWSDAAYLPRWIAQAIRNTDGLVGCGHYHVCQIIPAIASRVAVTLDGIGGGLFRGDIGGADRLRLATSQQGVQGVMLERILLPNFNTAVPLREIAAWCEPLGVAGIEEGLRASIEEAWQESAEASSDVRDRLGAMELRDRIRRFCNHGSFNVRCQLEVRMPYLATEMIELYRRLPAEICWSGELFLGLYRHGGPLAHLGRIPRQTGLPMINTRFDCAAQWPATQAKRVLRRVTRGRLRFADRTAYADYAGWYRGPLASWISECLLGPDAASSEFLNGAEIKRVVREHFSAVKNRASILSALLTFELWCQQTLKRRAPPSISEVGHGL